MEKTSPMRRLWQLAAAEHRRLRMAIALAAVGVLAGIVPYWAAAKMITALLSETPAAPHFYFILCLAAFVGYALRSILYAQALARHSQCCATSARASSKSFLSSRSAS